MSAGWFKRSTSYQLHDYIYDSHSFDCKHVEWHPQAAKPCQHYHLSSSGTFPGSSKHCHEGWASLASGGLPSRSSARIMYGGLRGHAWNIMLRHVQSQSIQKIDCRASGSIQSINSHNNILIISDEFCCMWLLVQCWKDTYQFLSPKPWQFHVRKYKCIHWRFDMIFTYILASCQLPTFAMSLHTHHFWAVFSHECSHVTQQEMMMFFPGFLPRNPKHTLARESLPLHNTTTNLTCRSTVKAANKNNIESWDINFPKLNRFCTNCFSKWGRPSMRAIKYGPKTSQNST